jgi:uncharacterized protein with beta-barrel porin domain
MTRWRDARVEADEAGRTVHLRFWPASTCESAVGGGASGLHALLRCAAAALVALIFTTAISEQAAAQGCTSLPCPPQQPPPPASNGSIQASSQGSLFDIGSHFQSRLGALTSFRDAASAGNNPQGGGAESTYDRYRIWFEGYGMTTRTDAQGEFLGDRRKVYGGIAGVGVTVAPGVTFGLAVDSNRTDIDVPGASGRIDLTQVGVIGNFERGPWNLGATVIHGFGSVHSSRFDTGGLSTASYFARLWGAMAELSYYVALPNNSRLVPKLTFDWLRSSTDSFTETGGTAPVSGSGVTASRVRMLVGGEIGHSWLVGRQIFDFAVYARLVENLQQNIGDLAVSDTTVVSSPQLVAGVRESSAGADAGAAFSVKVSELARLYAAYDGRFRGNLTSHSGTVGAEFRF